ncbi:efflux RND transporter permease subunit [Halomonas denitrificans]|nr:efflux RND transporter permease subunit [Halomonas denitrificans]
MSWLNAALERRRLVLATVLLLSLIGAAAWFGMNRQEDPFFPYRYAQVVVQWPGAEPAEVERLVLNPVEEELAQVEEVHEIIGAARLGVAVLTVGLGQHVYDTGSAWDRVRVALDRAQQRIPPEAGTIELDDRSMDAHGIVLAITGSDDPLVRLDAARSIRRDLFGLRDIARIELLADPGEQLLIQLDPSRASAVGLGPDALIAQLAERNRTVAGGSLDVDGRSLLVNPSSDFDSLDELAATPIELADGALVPLSDIASVSIVPREPATERMWIDGRPAIGLGIVIPDNRVNAVEFGRDVRALIERIRPRYEPLVIEEMFYQPRWVEQRLSELGRSLVIGVVTVAVVLLLFMGLRLGLLVASLLPLVTFSALALFAIGGGVLHQMAIAGMVIALGMLVDNAIVMAENLQYHLDRGLRRAAAGARAVRELAGPLTAATGTTLAAFTPLLLSRGDTADFTRGIPIMVMLVLTVSLVYALTVTPLSGAIVLHANPGTDRRASRFERIGRRLGGIATGRPGRVLIAAALLLGVAATLAQFLPRDFFPSTDRNQLIVDLRFPEGTRTTYSALQARGLAGQLREREDVEAVHVFAGFSGPRFYYNLIGIPASPHLARLVVISRDSADLPDLMHDIRRIAPRSIPEAQVIAHRLGQGPPIDAPVELRLYGRDPDALHEAALLVMRVLRSVPGAEDVRHKLGTGIPSLDFEIDIAEAQRFGVTRAKVARLLADASLGRSFSVWRAGTDPIDMRLRAPEGEAFAAEALAGLEVATPDGRTVPLAQFVRPAIGFQPAVIEHRDLQRLTSVLAETADDVTVYTVLDAFERAMRDETLPDGVRLAIGGAAAEAGDANSALFSALPIGAVLLLAFLLWQFNSFRLTALVLVTVPLAAVGVVPGLLLAGQPFGFTAMLGVVALVGIVVNNAIVLLDRAERERHENRHSAQDAIRAAIERRTRPILMTTTTTVLGLLPLVLTESTLWPPMAWAIISGLVMSTALTLLVIPALYSVLFGKR